MPDLVDDARAPGAHLVGLPERRDLGRHLVLEPAARGGREGGIVERLEDAAELQLRLQHRAPRGLGGVGRDHELERDALCAPGERGGLDPALLQPAERLCERLARDPLLALVASPAAHAVPRLGDVGELEVEPERAQDGRRAVAVEGAHEARERRVIGLRAGLPRLARELAHALDVGQQLLAVLLDEHAAEGVADQADVAPQRCVAPATAQGGGVVGADIRHVASL